ncbi:MAG: hypothetical protein KA807_08935 [Prolixibacteraceae bacterium]|nr:hypothetical protein [Prolixibacteraceae bacterium]
MEVARQVLQPDGIVILHDAQKKHYHQGLEVFQHQKFFNTGTWYPLQKEPNQVWIGSNIDHEIFKKLKDY